ncbi:hypothetical protein DFR71_6673 [Nocardia alba]|uniref:Porin n=1 Tax=Nocardia alba TaxID=225051 RepID=A0A4R1FBK9_9NOCA|nr:hypothetical protein DFR71_6673 [Nocardia alba]
MKRFIASSTLALGLLASIGVGVSAADESDGTYRIGSCGVYYQYDDVLKACVYVGPS